jgi:uncharacterized protein YuzE
MKISYDPAVDALYIQFQAENEKVAESLQIREGIVLDMAKDGQIFGLEILDASRRMPPAEISRVNLNLPKAS